MTRYLIVNADDCNLTPGVTRAILECHETGIVSSTTWMANLPADAAGLRQIRKSRSLGVGIHLNITLGSPSAGVKRVSSLLDENGKFRRRPQRVKAGDVETEWRAQIRLFKKMMGRLPTHLDTHHHLHAQSLYLKIIRRLSAEFRLPFRRPFPVSIQSRDVTDSFFGDLNVQRYWKKPALMRCLKRLPEGTSEMMCHPGYVDAALRRISSLTTGRGQERRLFAQPSLRKWLAREGIQLVHYGLWYNPKTGKKL